MEFTEMSVEQLEERKAAIVSEIDVDGADLDALEAEMKSINTELESRAQAEAKKAEIRKAVADGAGKVIESAPETREGEKTMTEMEVRKTNEYALAYLRAIKNNDLTECRALLSINATGGQVPVPEILDEEIRTAWEKHELLSLVKKTYYKGNVKVGFELSATGASVHVEGAAAPDEEEITIGVVELKAESIKKWITVSDEAIEGTTVDTIGYLYKEIAQKIAEKAEEVLVGKIDAAPSTSSATAAAVAVLKAGVAADTVVNALALLSGSARDIRIAMNRGTYAAFAGVALSANYAIDVFAGLKDKIVFTDKLPSIATATEDDTYIIIGDFGYGAQANFPNGDEITIKYDDLSLAEKDLVKLVGRQYVGMGVVAPGAFVKVTAPAAG